MTTLGLLSDSHGRATTTQAAVRLLLDHGAEVLIHLGDVGSTQVLDALAIAHPGSEKQIVSHVVFGNTDWDRAALGRYASDIGVTVHDPAGVIEIDGRRIGFTHGHEPGLVQELLDQPVDFLLHGHTHVQADHQQGPTRIINPGALFRAPRYTVATLTPATGATQVLEVPSVSR